MLPRIEMFIILTVGCIVITWDNVVFDTPKKNQHVTHINSQFHQSQQCTEIYDVHLCAEL